MSRGIKVFAFKLVSSSIVKICIVRMDVHYCSLEVKDTRSKQYDELLIG